MCSNLQNQVRKSCLDTLPNKDRSVWNFLANAYGLFTSWSKSITHEVHDLEGFASCCAIYPQNYLGIAPVLSYSYTCIDSGSGSSWKYPDSPVILCTCHHICECMSSLHTIHISHISLFSPSCILIMELFMRKSDLWMFNLILEDLFVKSIIKVNALIQSLGTIKNLQIGDELWVNSISLPINWKQCMPLKTL